MINTDIRKNHQCSSFKNLCSSAIIFITVLFITSNVTAALPWDKVGGDILPHYPNSKLVNREEMKINGKRTITLNYQTQDATQEVLDFYKENLNRLGWKLRMEDTQNGMLAFNDIKGRWVNVGVFYLEGLTRINVNYMVDGFTAGTPQAAEGQDCNGKDLPWLSRYPGSVRTLDLEAKGNKFLIYTSQSRNFDAVMEFYRSQLLGKGWKLVDRTDRTKEEMQESREAFKARYEAEIKSKLPPDEKGWPQVEASSMLVFEDRSHICVVLVSQLPDKINTIIQYMSKQ